MAEKFVLLITSAPSALNKSISALKFARAVINQGHTLVGVFFYGDGVLHANALMNPASDELNVNQEWREFSVNSNVPLHNCIAASQRRGILSEELASQAGLECSNVTSEYEMSGLGQFSELLLQATRVVQF